MPRRPALRPLLILLLSAGLAGAAAAASSAASSASQSIGFSIGSLSGALKNSSGSSSRAADVADGDYEVVDIVAISGERDDLVRMTLHAAFERGTTGDLVLELPRPAVDEGRLSRGGIVTARQRPYGVEFASRATGRAFFLVLDDDWYHELRANAVPS